MVDWNKKFKSEFDAAKTAIASDSNYEKSTRGLAKKLKLLLATDGFDSGHASSLSKLRDKVKRKGIFGSISEDQGILQAVNAWSTSNVGTISSSKKKRAACLKLLRHVYLLNKWGNKKVWVVNLPDDFTDWPSKTLTNATTKTQIKQLLASNNEHFSSQQKKDLAGATQKGMVWCQKTCMVLANAAKKASSRGSSRTKARDLVKRWFADPGTSDSTLDTYIATLDRDFKKIISRLNKGNFIVTDWVPFRGTSAADELDFLRAEAFTFSSYGEGLDVVYIESNFFVDNSGNILNGKDNWTRIIVHELTHLVCGTTDVNNGNARYAWYGIGPHNGYPGSDCIRNADNWAFFAADCANALSKSEQNKALKII